MGTQTDGGYWLDASRLSSHNHTGGLNGNAVTAVIPPGSITAGQLDPAVLAPYALTDGSKPFSGQVTMQADAIIRDALHFGEQGTALAPDAHLTRAAVGRLEVGGTLSLTPTVGQAGLLANGHAVISAAAGLIPLQLNRPEASGSMPLLTLSRANTNKWYAGLTNTDAFGLFTAAFGVPVSVTPTGSLTLVPDAGQPAVVGPPAADLVLTSPASAIRVNAGANVFSPTVDNVAYCGFSGQRWAGVWAGIGTINTSAAEAKTDITPLAPADALAAALATDPVTFTYLAPAPSAAQYELPDDPEQAEAVLYQRLTGGPLAAAARHQAGFVLGSPDYATDPLFETGQGQSNAANTAGILLGAVHELNRRLTAGGL